MVNRPEEIENVERRDAINKESLRKNNEELDGICKYCCMCIAWLAVPGLFIYVIVILINH